MKTRFVLVDFENVQPKSIGALNGRAFKIKIFAGASQSRVPIALASALQVLGPDAEYIRIDGNGKNALDFHIAYYIGRLAAQNPGASFCVISKDTGFDPLIKHLKAQGIDCRRSKSMPDIPENEPSGARPPAGNVDAIVVNLAARKAAKPKTLKTLRSTINALFKNELPDPELDVAIEELMRRGIVKVADGKVNYDLPPQS